jgi:DNA processing protein
VVSRGFHVVSGGAEGCDRAAHEGALEAGGTTTVVLASGHDHPSPRRHREFFDDIVARQGALVSAYWPTVPPRRHQFLARNQTIAALAECVVVVRARARSGALSTAAHAFRMGKNVLAVPGHVGHELSQGCHHLLARGASALTSHADLMRVLGCDTRGRSWGVFDGREPDLWGNLREPNPPSIEGLNRVDQAIFETLSQEGKLDLDALCVRSGYPGEAVIAALVSLELAGVVHKTVNARYVVVHSAQEKHER